MRTEINESSITLTHKREPDGKVAITAVHSSGETFALSIWPQDSDDRSRFINELCARFPGLNGERRHIRQLIEKIVSATKIDLRFNTCGQINGRASCSARLWSGSKVIETASLNLLSAESREKAIKHLSDYVAPRSASKRKKLFAERDLRQLFMQELQRVLTTPAQQPQANRDHCPYYDDGHGIVMKTKDGEVVLTSFSARIVAIVTRSDGQEAKSDFELEVKTGEMTRRILVKAKEFAEMKWPIEQLHDDGYINPDRNAAAHARAAIMWFSRNPKPEKKMVHTHTGWIKLESGAYAFLHAGGAITADPAAKIEVQVHKALSRYALPVPPEGAALRDCIRASIRLLDLAPGRSSFPGFCAIWRSMLGSCDSGIFTVGPSGTFKSELMALRLQHFGEGLDRIHAPANWSSTANALELLAFAAKDVPLGIDDFAPYGSRNAIDALHGTAERLYRAQGNNSGRQRSSKDAQVDEPKPPRGLIMSTGEDVPRGQSVRARMMIEEISPGDISPKKLSECQHDARKGLYAGCCAGFIRWKCEENRIAEAQKTLRAKVDELRDRAVSSDLHRRTPELAANLAIGFVYFLQFALEKEAITEDEAAQLWKRCWSALGEAVQTQLRFQADNDPAARFIELFSSALSSGEAHLTNPDGSAPDPAIAGSYGWWKRSEMATIFEPRGICAGCVDGDGIYLDFNAAHKAAQRAGGGDGLVIAAATLRKRLQEKGLIEGGDDGRTAVRKRFKGVLQMMVKLAPGAMGGNSRAQRAQQQQAEEELPIFEAKTGDNP